MIAGLRHWIEDEIISVFLGFTDKYIHEKFNDIINNRNAIETRGYQEERTIHDFINEHNQFRKVCQKAKAQYFEIDQDYIYSKLHLKKIIKITLIIYPIFVSLVCVMIGFKIEAIIMFSAFFIIALIYLHGYYWILEGDRLSKYIWFKKQIEFGIREIDIIEAYKIEEVGNVHFYLGKGPHEDEYHFVFNNTNRIKSHAHCYNSENVTIGRYLNKRMKVKLVERTKYKIFNT